MRTIIIDLRCLQDNRQAERGIAAHARNIVGLARQVSPLARGSRIVGIVNPALPDLPDQVRDGMDELRPNAYVPDAPAGTLFLNPSPKTPDQIYIGRLLLDKNILKAALVYDFIPFENQPDYFNSLNFKLDYLTSMIWLDRYDLFLPISAHTQAGLSKHLSLGARKSVVTGVALPPWLEHTAPRPSGNKHILVVAGDDVRKNPELVIRAHAKSKVLQQRGIKIIIGGKYPAARQDEYRAIARQAGGNPNLLSVPGLVSQDELVARYQDALCVVTPSRAEGFSLPVIEAMAAGVVSLASDIPPHAELVKNPALRFAPDDVDGLGRLLECIANDPDMRAEIIAGQAAIWPRFSGGAVASKAWAAIDAMQIAKPYVSANKKPHLALLSPLPPARSGVADYSACCARALDSYADVSLYPEDSVSALPHLAQKFDRVISVMGNSRHHEIYFELLRRYGGACVCHDSRLLQFYVNRYGLEYAARIASKELRRRVTAAEIEQWMADEMLREASFLAGIAESAAPLIFHARMSVDIVRRRFDKTAHFIPFAIYRPWAAAALSATARATARQQLGMKDDEIHIVSFGFIGAAKGLLAGLQTVRELAARHVNVTLHWLGKAAEAMAPWRMLAAQYGIAHRIVLHDDFVSESLYRDFLLAADFGLQLRLTGRGNISGALQDCIAAGLPSVADDDLAAALDAPDYVARVDTAGDPALIADAFEGLIAKGLNRQRDMAARADYCDAHSMENYAKKLCGVLGL